MAHARSLTVRRVSDSPAAFEHCMQPFRSDSLCRMHVRYIPGSPFLRVDRCALTFISCDVREELVADLGTPYGV